MRAYEQPYFQLTWLNDNDVITASEDNIGGIPEGWEE